MENVTIDDLKRFGKMLTIVEEKGDSLIKLKSELDPKEYGEWLYSEGVFEVTDNQIGFICGGRWQETAYKYFTFEDFLSENYIEELQKELENKKRSEKLELEELKKRELLAKEESERKIYEELKLKFNQETANIDEAIERNKSIINTYGNPVK